MKKRILAILTMLMLCLALMPDAAFADEDNKTLTVDASATEIEGETYNTIQGAINYICDTYYANKVDYTYTDGKPETVDDSWYLQAQYSTTWKYRQYPTEMSGWTIVVNSGTYSHFSVYEGLDGITIKAANNATVTVNTWTGATNDEIVSTYATKNASAYRAYTVTVATRNITIDGLNFTVGEYDSGAWCRAAVTSTGGTTGTDNTGLHVANCNFTNLGEQGCGSTYLTGEIVWNCGIVVGFDSAIIEGCTFSRFGNAGIYICADGRVVDNEGVYITNNTFTSCDYAFNCYYGGNSGLTTVTADDIGGPIYFTGNTVTGTSTLRSKVCILDQGVKGSIGSVNVSNNNFTYTMVVIENMDESPCTVNDVLADNTWSNGSFYVEADAYYWDGTYQGTLTAEIPDYVYYESPESDTGYWVLNVNLEDYSTSTNTAFVQALIDAANATGSHTLSITYDDEGKLTDTITALKDCIYWVSGTMKEDLPGLDKVIVTNDSEVEQDDVARGDTVNYKLTSNVPSNLDEYIDYTGVGDNTNVVPLGTVKTTTTTDDEDNETTENVTYTLTFHDILAESLSYNNDATVTLVTYKLDENGNLTTTVEDTVDVSKYATVTTDTDDECTFEVSVDLLELYSKGLIKEKDFGSAKIIVTYSADLSENATAGSYTNTAWVSYEDTESKKDTVTVNTYAIKILKYDQEKASNANASPADADAGLAGAEFTLYSDSELTDEVANSLTSKDDGYITVDGLDAGTYYLVETKAPNGYVASSQPMTVTVDSVTAGEDHTILVEFANAPIPSTGGAGTRMYLIGGACLIAAAGTVFVVSRRKKDE